MSAFLAQFWRDEVRQSSTLYSYVWILFAFAAIFISNWVGHTSCEDAIGIFEQ